MAEIILILGCGTMQLPALRIARDMGWTVAGADGNPEAEGRNLCDIFHPVDLKDTGGLIALARRLRDGPGLDGVFTAGTDFSHSVALVADSLGLPGHRPEAALLATDKVLMRKRFRERGVPSPDFAEAGGNDDLSALIGTVEGPWVVKPVDSMGARGVVRVDSRDELADALESARSYSRSGRALLETYMEGPEFSLDALVEDGRLIRCGLADRHIVFPPRFIEIGHTIPSDIDQSTAESIWEVFGRGVEALGLTRGAAKGDVKLTPRGPMIGEIAARLSGGYMSGWTWPYASGVEPTRGALRLAVGLDARLPEPSRHETCAERALISIDGRVRRLDGREAALALPGVRDVFLRCRSGDRVVFPRNNVEKVGNVIATGRDAREAADRALGALRALCLELDPSDPVTGAFLDGSGPFPPDAFDVSGPSARGLSVFLNDLWRRWPPMPSRGGLAAGPPVLHRPPESACLDSAGRSVDGVLVVLEEEGRIRLTGQPDGTVPPGSWLSDFWKALIRGGLPGARWYLERPAL